MNMKGLIKMEFASKKTESSFRQPTRIAIYVVHGYKLLHTSHLL